MKKYRIKEIYSDGYERFATMEEVGKDVTIHVHFLEYDEYLQNDEKSLKKKIGDTLEGNVSIGLVTFSQKVTKDLIHDQKIQKSPHIQAIIEVVQIIDAYSIYARSSISEDKILVEFETAVSYKVGERVLVVGSLELIESSSHLVKRGDSLCITMN